MNEMKKLYIVMMLVLTGTMAVAQTSVWNGGRTVWTQGNGTEANPYLIESAENLAYLAYAVNKGYDMLGVHFRLTTDIDLNGSEELQWVPIGLGDRWFNEDGCDRGDQASVYLFNPRTYFRGHFDGGEHSISNLYINQEDGNNLGLFGVVRSENEENPVVIENVFVTNGYIKGNSCCGGIVGRTYSGNRATVLISRCWSGVTLECRGGGDVGGIVGVGSIGLHIQKCYNVGNVNGRIVGGILGSDYGEIVECYNKGDITGTYAGGIVGLAINGHLTIYNCYNLGDIVANTDYGPTLYDAPAGPAGGGIAGAEFSPWGIVSITNCYNVGSVSSTRDMGCIMAYAVGDNKTFENNYYISTCSDENEDQGTPLSEDYMCSQAFVDFLNSLGTGQLWALDENNTNGGFPVIVTIDLAVDEIPEISFHVYPNPAQGQFTVEGTGKMMVTNLFGQTVLVRDIDGQTNVSLPRGMYFVKLGNATRKVVVE